MAVRPSALRGRGPAPLLPLFLLLLARLVLSFYFALSSALFLLLCLRSRGAVPYGVCLTQLLRLWKSRGNCFYILAPHLPPVVGEVLLSVAPFSLGGRRGPAKLATFGPIVMYTSVHAEAGGELARLTFLNEPLWREGAGRLSCTLSLWQVWGGYSEISRVRSLICPGFSVSFIALVGRAFVTLFTWT